MELKLKVTVVVEPDDGSFYAHCPDLKGLHACGDTEEEAVQNALEAVRLYVVSLLKHAEPIPIGVIERPSMGRIMGEWVNEKLRPHAQASFVREVAVPAFA